MQSINNEKSRPECPDRRIHIRSDREIVDCDMLTHKYRTDPKGFFLVRLQDDKVCCGYVNWDYEMTLELRGTDVQKILKEIARRRLCENLEHMGYIADELRIARSCFDSGKEYVQR